MYVIVDWRNFDFDAKGVIALRGIAFAEISLPKPTKLVLFAGGNCAEMANIQECRIFFPLLAKCSVGMELWNVMLNNLLVWESLFGMRWHFVRRARHLRKWKIEYVNIKSKWKLKYAVRRRKINHFVSFLPSFFLPANPWIFFRPLKNYYVQRWKQPKDNTSN